jgi:hypothetical protein
VRKRSSYTPSSGHRLIRLVTDKQGRRSDTFKKDLAAFGLFGVIESIASEDRFRWAVQQLLECPAQVRRGWAARRKRVR